MIQIETSQLITIWVFITANILIGAGITLLTSYVEDWLKKGKIYNNMGDKQVILRKTEMREGQSP